MATATKQREPVAPTTVKRAPAAPRSRARRALRVLGSVTLSAGLLLMMIVLVALALAGGAALAGP